MMFPIDIYDLGSDSRCQGCGSSRLLVSSCSRCVMLLLPCETMSGPQNASSYIPVDCLHQDGS